MKKHIFALLALALALASTIGSAPNVSAQAQFLSGKLLQGKLGGVGSDGRMKWDRGISSYGAGVTDSTRISLPAAAAAADFADTTAWLDLSQVKFRQDFAKQPIVMFQVNKQLTTTTDSIGFQVQYSNDIGSTGAIKLGTTVAYMTTVAATTAGVSAGADGIVGTVVAVSPDAATGHAAGTAATLPYRYVRLVVLNADTSGATGRSYFSVTPVLFGWL